jgi:pantothenate synthetase
MISRKTRNEKTMKMAGVAVVPMQVAAYAGSTRLIDNRVLR